MIKENLEKKDLWYEFLEQDLEKMKQFHSSIYKEWVVIIKREISSIFYNYKINLKVPNVIIEDYLNVWGKWSNQYNTIYLSKRLIVCCSWDSVVETIKHELSHMIVDKLFCVVDNKPHGVEFTKACLKLGISAKASASDADMGISLDQKQNDQPDKHFSMIKKIQKLFALSSSMNEYESQNAIKKAKDLMYKYNLNSDIKLNSEFRYRILSNIKTRVPSEDIYICNILNDFFFVEYILVPQYCIWKRKKVTAIEILGLEHNLDMAEYIYYFLKRKIEQLWSAYKKQYQLKGIRQKKSYMLGVLDGVRAKLKRQSFVNNELNALIIKKDKALVDFFSYRYPRIRKTKSRGTAINYGSYQKGITHGKNMDINKPIQSSKKTLFRLICKN